MVFLFKKEKNHLEKEEKVARSLLILVRNNEKEQSVSDILKIENSGAATKNEGYKMSFVVYPSYPIASPISSLCDTAEHLD